MSPRTEIVSMMQQIYKDEKDGDDLWELLLSLFKIEHHEVTGDDYVTEFKDWLRDEFAKLPSSAKRNRLVAGFEQMSGDAAQAQLQEVYAALADVPNWVGLSATEKTKRLVEFYNERSKA